MQDGYVRIDAIPPVHPSDAVKLMVHHLSLAVAYFEATPDEDGPALAEMARTLDPTISLPAARAWYDAMTKAYDSLDNDG